MCLKIFHRYTFSNREAFERLIKRLEFDYLTRSLTDGKICVIRTAHIIKNRQDKSYNELRNMMAREIINCDLITFYSWKNWDSAVEMVKNMDVFGEITIECQ